MIPWEGPLPEPGARRLADMADVLAAPEYADRDPSRPLYYMYRDCARSDEDRRWLADHDVRYDITVIMPGVIGPELVKTKGHYHPENPAGVGFPEVYEVMSGRAHFLLQNREASSVLFVEATAGEVVVIPPGYGHVTINPGDEDLVMANLVSTAFASEYAPYARLGGAAYYEMEDGSIVKNNRYPDAGPVRRAVALPVPAFGTGPGVPLYTLLGREESVRFLNHPEDYADAFSGCLRDAGEVSVCAQMP
ncbi:glucose-6-phosphate isomerase family protein [Methanofollis fontis]|uniref:glucose-6-phosphate isomerase n=1 Tax=Methanofollis fontis TaxID=2052832 RepID=A0A483CZZ6_9EURY|nr:glucose-6-phosphate isomerase family protein [Methanofollis fontis]TAJ45819.1 glucose-6-phosphate isomerase [Methanofollis fontis]